MRFSYFKISSASFLITYLSPGIATSINIHGPSLLSRIMMSGLLLIIILSVRTCCFHNMVTLPSRLISTDFGTWYMAECLLSNFYNKHKQIIIVIIIIIIAREGQKLNFLILFWLMVLKKSKARGYVLTPVLYLFT